MENEIKADYKQIKKITYCVNTAILICVVCLFFVFHYFHVTYMMYHSVPTFICYIIFYAVIASGHLSFYLWAVYSLITIYMSAATICMGVTLGFNLYCISMIPIVFFVNYIAYKIRARKPHSGIISTIIIISYLGSTAYTFLNGPVYDVKPEAAAVFYILNSLIVFAFLISYTSMMIKMITNSDEKLSYMAHYDNLTGLLNRHYMMEKMKNMEKDNSIGWISMLDIDKFKSVNDIYGHAAGDYVLKELSRILNENCQDFVIARWGGEEFLMIPKDPHADFSILETLRQKVEENQLAFDNKNFNITISIGAARFDSASTIEKCIQSADFCLYASKNSGRNRVTIR